ncbi:class I SAM-dependent methyltransferase [Nocardioides sp. P5_C9_2]
MGTEPVRAGSAWLALREPVDAHARSEELVEVLRGRLTTRVTASTSHDGRSPAGPSPDRLVVHDLGSGTGSTARWLAPRLAAGQRWVLHDRDPDLLAIAEDLPPPRSSAGEAVTVETRLGDITRLYPEDLADASLVTASALLDMFTADELARFVATCVRPACPVLVTLSVVGRVELAPGDPLDARVAAAFNDHQRRDTPGGRLLGPDAAAHAVEAFQGAGLQVTTRPSAWRLGPASAALAAEWLAGWVGAAVEQDPGLREAAASWTRRRRVQLAAGALSVTLHHVDLLALPR